MERSVRVHPGTRLSGRIRVPGDKSISHRALIFSALAPGISTISGLGDIADVSSTRSCLDALGVVSEPGGNGLLRVHGREALAEPGRPLDCGNSGTTMRLLAGVLAAQDFSCTLSGDASLSRRPMRRVAEPLMEMGAEIQLAEGGRAPFSIRGRRPLKAIEYTLEVASAQVKSAILLAGLYARGDTILSGGIHSRDHSERLLRHMGVELEVARDRIRMPGGQPLCPRHIEVPGDPSSAAFWMAAACMLDGSRVEIQGLSLNSTRLGFVRVLERMGCAVQRRVLSELPEPVGDLSVDYAPLAATEVEAGEVPYLIDELPLIAVLACRARGKTRVRGARELRHKESDRIQAIADNLGAMGVEVEIFDDGFCIDGPQPLRGADIDARHDHRIAMAFGVAALAADAPCNIRGAQWADISYPGFFDALGKLSRG